MQLPANWWIVYRENNQTMKLAVAYGLAKFFFDEVQKRLDDNYIGDSFPPSWKKLAVAVGYSGTGKLYRKKSGQTSINTREFLSFSTILSKTLGDLIPSNEKWLAGTVEFLCSDIEIDLADEDFDRLASYFTSFFEERTKFGKNEIELEVDNEIVRTVAGEIEEDRNGLIAKIKSVAAHIESKMEAGNGQI